MIIIRIICTVASWADGIFFEIGTDLFRYESKAYEHKTHRYESDLMHNSRHARGVAFITRLV